MWLPSPEGKGFRFVVFKRTASKALYLRKDCLLLLLNWVVGGCRNSGIGVGTTL